MESIKTYRCIVCKKKFKKESIQGRRTPVFCSPTCREIRQKHTSSVWQKRHKKWRGKYREGLKEGFRANYEMSSDPNMFNAIYI